MPAKRKISSKGQGVPGKARKYRKGRELRSALPAVREEEEVDFVSTPEDDEPEVEQPEVEKPEVIYISDDEVVPEEKAPSPPPLPMRNKGKDRAKGPPVVEQEALAPLPFPKLDRNKDLAKAPPATDEASKKKKAYDLVADGTRILVQVVKEAGKHSSVSVSHFDDSREVMIKNSKNIDSLAMTVEISKKMEQETRIASQMSRILVLTVYDYTVDKKLAPLTHGAVVGNVMSAILTKLPEADLELVPLIQTERAEEFPSPLVISVYYNMTPTTPQDKPVKIPPEVIETALDAVCDQLLSLI